MDVKNVTNYVAGTDYKYSNTGENAKKVQEEKQPIKDEGAVYEKNNSAESKKTTYTNQTERTALIAQLKADAEKQTAQLRSLVEQMMTKQGQTLGLADDMWKFLAKGDLKDVDPEVVAQAQKDVAEDGYWGAEQTSDRILSFAKALAGNDSKKAEELLDAFKQGYEEATKTWGDELPELSKNTYDMVEEKFKQWQEEA